MSVDLMRSAIKKVYPGESWERKVSKMSDSQVIAIYQRFLREKKLA